MLCCTLVSARGKGLQLRSHAAVTPSHWQGGGALQLLLCECTVSHHHQARHLCRLLAVGCCVRWIKLTGSLAGTRTPYPTKQLKPSGPAQTHTPNTALRAFTSPHLHDAPAQWREPRCRGAAVRSPSGGAAGAAGAAQGPQGALPTAVLYACVREEAARCSCVAEMQRSKCAPLML